MSLADSFAPECYKRCPELHSCVEEHVLRQGRGEQVTLTAIINERVAVGTLPERCSKGPVKIAVNLLASKGDFEHVAQATSLKLDAWGDLAAIACRSQGNIGFGHIEPIN